MNEKTENDVMMIPLCVFEEAQDNYQKDKEQMRKTFADDKNKLHKTNNWLIVLLIVMFILALGSNMAWLAYENSFDKYSWQQDGNGTNNINTGTQGDLYGAEADSETEAQP